MAPATLRDVSERAGRSRSTASLVVRGSDRTSAETSARCVRRWKSPGVHAKRPAASMCKSNSFTMALVAGEIRDPCIAEPRRGLPPATGRTAPRNDRSDH
jgi:LacI family transcriptional regulator